MKRVKLSLFVLALILISSMTVASQSPVYLSVVASSDIEEIWGEDIFDPFEAAHPGVEVIVVEAAPTPIIGRYSLQENLQKSRDYVTLADVVLVDPYIMPIETTRAGHYLDLKPLINADSTFSLDDFYPVVAPTFQWDGGVWALPSAADFWTLTYDPGAFDAANLAYPDANWSLDDFAHATRTLTRRDSNDEVVTPGFITVAAVEPLYLLSHLSGGGFHDTTSLPNPPLFTRPALIDTVETLVALVQEGALQQMNFGNPAGWENQVPMRIAPLSDVTSPFPASSRTEAAPLPGGGMATHVRGYAVSAGTVHPELAYELVKYLTTDPVITSAGFRHIPAYRYAGNPDDADTDFQLIQNITPEITALIDVTKEKRFSTSTLPYRDYLLFAFTSAFVDDGLNAEQLLQQEETLAREQSRLAVESGEEFSIVVSQPDLPPELTSDEVSLTFGVMSYTSLLSNRDDWQQFFTEFAENDSQVGHVSLDSRLFADVPEEWDCFFAPGNMTGMPYSSTLLDLSPLMNADPNFNSQDFVRSVPGSYQQETGTFGLPMALYPVGLWYDEQAFIDQNLLLPDYGWTVQDLETVFDTVSSRPVLELRPNRTTDLLALIAAYGGLPFDFRTTPPALDFTGAETSAAIEEVMFLLESGLVEQETGGITTGVSMGDSVLFVDVLDSRSTGFSLMQNDNIDTTSYRLTTLPAGADYTPLVFSVGGGYITASSPYPDACYRLLTRLARQPDLFQTMPARYSIIDTMQMSISGELLDFYHHVAELSRNPETIVITGQTGTAFERFQRALDASLADDVTLRDALNDAEQQGN